MTSAARRTNDRSYLAPVMAMGTMGLLTDVDWLEPQIMNLDFQEPGIRGRRLTLQCRQPLAKTDRFPRMTAFEFCI
jgi:hypothetical protein